MVELKPPAPQGILKKPTLKIERKEFIKQGTNIESEYEFIGKVVNIYIYIIGDRERALWDSKKSSS